MDGRALWLSPDGPPRATLDGVEVPVCERRGLLFVWLGGGAPTFALEPLDEDGFGAIEVQYLDFETRPAMVMQDLADLSHFESVHGYAGIRSADPLDAQGAQLRAGLDFDWPTGLPGLWFRSRFTARLDGLGLQVNDVTSMRDWIRTRHLVMPTPLDARTTRVFLGMAVRAGGRSTGALRALVQAVSFRYFYRDVRRDSELWTGRSAHRPAQNERMAEYLRWTAQFAS